MTHGSILLCPWNTIRISFNRLISSIHCVKYNLLLIVLIVVTVSQIASPVDPFACGVLQTCAVAMAPSNDGILIQVVGVHAKIVDAIPLIWLQDFAIVLNILFELGLHVPDSLLETGLVLVADHDVVARIGLMWVNRLRDHTLVVRTPVDMHLQLVILQYFVSHLQRIDARRARSLDDTVRLGWVVLLIRVIGVLAVFVGYQVLNLISHCRS